MQRFDLQRLAETRQVTQDYASYAHYRTGLGTILGGMAVMLVYGFTLLPVHQRLIAVFALSLTLIWLFGKEVIRRTHYRSFGQVHERWPRLLRGMHIVLVLLLTLISGWIWWDFLTSGIGSVVPIWPTLLVMAAFPLITWFLLRTLHELLIGIYLLTVSAVTISGGIFPSGMVPFIPLFGIYAIGIGIVEHRRYMALAKQLEE